MRDSLLVLLACIAITAACGESTAIGAPGVAVTGVWKYAGRQTAPAEADLQGTLTFNSQAGAQIAGVLDFIERDVRGQQRRIVGTFSGRTIDSTTLDFDARLGATTRRHVGRVVGDSLTGTWIEQSVSGGAPVASGSFRAARLR